MTASFRTRILGGAVLTAFVAVLTVWASVAFVLSQVVGPPDIGIASQVLEACLDDPARWAVQQTGDLRTELLDLDDPRVPDRVRRLPLDTDFDDPDQDRLHWRRLRDAGPCAVAKLEFQRPPQLELAFWGGILLGVFLAVLAVGFLSYWLTVRPLLARIHRLRLAVADIGERVYQGADDAVGDDLTAIGASMDDSHVRIREARDALVERHQALERYLAEIAHDLRTPLGSLMLAVQELAATTPGPSVARATTEVAYLSSLVDNLHQATRLRHGLDPQVGEVDLVELVQRVELRFRALGEAQGVSVNAAAEEEPVLVTAEPALLERALGNVVHNAVVHGGDNVAILLERTGDRFVLSVLDDGQGLPDDGLADLAARTFVTDPARRRSQGLGVAITNEVVHRLDWSIAYEAVEAGGLQVRIEGPCR